MKGEERGLGRLTIEDILAVKYLEDYEWSPDGNWIAYIYDDGGITDCWVVASDGSGEPRKLTQARRAVSGLCWNPTTNALTISLDGDLWLADPSQGFALRRLTAVGDVVGAGSWSPDGGTLAFSSGGALTLFDTTSQLFVRSRVPGRAGGTAFWSPDGQRFLCRYLDKERAAHVAIVDRTGSFLWATTDTDGMPTEGRWIDNKSFVFGMSRDISRVNDLYLASLPAEGKLLNYAQIGVATRLQVEVKHVLRDAEPERKGALRFGGALPSPTGEHLLISSERDGWLHHYLYDVKQDSLTQVTFGQCEDFGHAGDQPQWSPDGSKFVYASNRNHRVERQLWVYDVSKGCEELVTSLPITNVNAKWAPDGQRLAFVHCDYFKNMDIWVMEASAQATPRQLTYSMPQGLEQKLQPTELVTYKGALDWDIDGFVFKPADFDPHKKYPGIVWVHGGPIRQMRGSWHPSRSYALFYAFNQYLASQGYIVMSINFRGGIGYGSEFRFGLYHKMGVDDVVDVVNAGRYLKDQPYIDEDKVAVYGLSYGGYMTLHALTQYPDEFCMGINIAGIWDFAQWTRWIESRSGRQGTMFSINFGGSPEESPELYAQGSPVTFKHNLKKPLINFHGTKDANVDFEQMDRIVDDCLKLGKEYEAYYYPGEVHTFAYRRTWLDAFPKMEREFAKYLKK